MGNGLDLDKDSNLVALNHVQLNGVITSAVERQLLVSLVSNLNEEII